jgi:hypothetical protein
MTTELYIAEMLYLNEADSHRYLVGVYSTQELAKHAGEIEKSWNTIHYELQIKKVILDAIDPEKLDWYRQSDPSGK